MTPQPAVQAVNALSFFPDYGYQYLQSGALTPQLPDSVSRQMAVANAAPTYLEKAEAVPRNYFAQGELKK